MQQHFRVYFNKISSMVEKTATKPKSTGLLSPSGAMKKDDKKQQDAMETVAEFVKGIRAARKGFKK